MSRSKISYLNKFYDLLDELEEKVGGRRQLDDCHGRMNWPKRGVYFFFEPGELRAKKPSSPCVVRVGANAVTAADTASTLWQRIEKHKGTKTLRGGDHRTSVFRNLVGDAIGQRNPELMPESWGDVRPISREMQELEYLHEIRVSKYLAGMTLLFVCVPDASGSDNMRKFIERKAIALLSNYCESSPDEPSSGWLGYHSTREKVQRSGLWNEKHVDTDSNPTFLNHFEEFIKAM